MKIKPDGNFPEVGGSGHRAVFGTRQFSKNDDMRATLEFTR
jgi:hypothetical protein